MEVKSLLNLTVSNQPDFAYLPAHQTLAALELKVPTAWPMEYASLAVAMLIARREMLGMAMEEKHLDKLFVT